MMDIIDVSSNCGSRAGALRAAGVATVIRYYSRDTTNPSKRLTRAEAEQLAAAGLRIGIVHEGRHGDRAENFDRDCGMADAQYAGRYGIDVIGQPAGTTIYFGVDFDASAAQVRDLVIPYFQGVAAGFATLADHPGYAVGVYGSGRTCKAVLDAGLATHAWLAQSRGWAGHDTFLASSQWTMNQALSTTVAGVSCDPNTVGEGKDIGDFVLTGAVASTASPSPVRSDRLFVNARSGLKVRSGPGTGFDAIPPALPYGTAVFPLRTQDGWTQIDLQGATPVAAAAVAAAAVSSGDAMHIPELIRQGSHSDGLKQARLTASTSLPGYPTNGCAAHLSALLQQAGIAVPMTWGAGKLASVLAARHWRRVGVGQQVPGDVGVCFDNNPDPPGADHIYLVVETHGGDEMLIADNQNADNDVPHKRFASGNGKTPTEYFLRA
jgi:hypothetical protein